MSACGCVVSDGDSFVSAGLCVVSAGVCIDVVLEGIDFRRVRDCVGDGSDIFGTVLAGL